MRQEFYHTGRSHNKNPHYAGGGSCLKAVIYISLTSVMQNFAAASIRLVKMYVDGNTGVW
jgi:hypothetical protein